MKRRDFLIASGSAAGLLVPAAAALAKPCPQPTMGATGGTSVTAACGSGKSYTTNFPLTENPISEGGVWTHAGSSWSKVQTLGGFACGTQTGSGGYNDSYAHLSGFGADHTASAIIKKDSGLQNFHECELHLRWNDTSSTASGYECNIAYNGEYCQIVRWEGGFGSFTELKKANGVTAPQTGDVFKASIVGSLIIVSMNNVEIIRASDTTWPTGNPGMGFYIESTTNNQGFGFSSFTATST